MIVADRLAELHFTAQHEASADLEQVEIVRLDPFLRGLLFTDGTVSRALEAQTLSLVTVEALEQLQTSPPDRAARYLDATQADECIRRRVVITSEETSLSVWAESYVIARRLPPAFLGVLDGSSQGIGGSVGQLKLESWRELLWFGLGPPPRWSGAMSAAVTLTRCYRIITQGKPALLISEAFAVEMQAGIYRLMGSSA
jgi:chorismate-pyruvate lyase